MATSLPPSNQDPAATPPARLPRPLTPFVGREREREELRTLIAEPDGRLVTLTGPGGVGKTRLALDVAATLQPAYPDSVWFVPLAPIADADLVAPTIASALGLRESGEAPLQQQVIGYLRETRGVLVLDNMEHLVEAAPFVAAVVATCPHVRVLSTSRVPLHISGEREYAVPPLPVPASATALAAVRDTAAVRLFVSRAHAVRPDFALTDANAGAVVEICRRLDGLPLAIELAAARVKLMSPQALLPRLDRRLPLLTGGARDVLPRQQTMHDTIAWSHDLLTSAEQALFRRLAVFAGGFSLEAAEAVVGDESRVKGVGDEVASASPITLHPSPSVLDLVTSLVDKSLLRQVDVATGDARLGMLETIREFGLDRLVAAGEDPSVRRAHARWCLHLAEEARPYLEGPRQSIWMDRLEADHDNLRAGLAWSAANDSEALLRLVAALWRFWVVRGHLGNGRVWLERALDAGDGLGSPAWIDAVYGASVFASMAEDQDRAVALAEWLLSTATEQGDRSAVGKAHNLLGNVDLKHGAFERARTRFEAAREHLQPPADDAWIAVVHDNLGTIAQNEGRFAAAAALLQEALAAWQRMGNAWGIAVAYHDLGDTYLNGGDRERAAHYFRESLALNSAERDLPGMAWGLERLGLVAAARGDAETAARLFAAVARLAASLGIAHPDVPGRHETALAAVRTALGDSAFAAAWQAGERLPLDAAVTEALAVADGPAAPVEPAPLSHAAPDHGLTPRQVEILRLLAQGKTDREIADALFISPRTAETHLARIYTRLGVSSRAAAVAYAFRHGLV